MGNLALDLESEALQLETKLMNKLEQESQASFSPITITFEQLKAMDHNTPSFIDTLQVKKYLPFGLKSMLVDDLISTIEFDENGIAYIDNCQFELFFKICICKYYVPNLILNPDEIVEQYDYLVETGIMNKIYYAIGQNDLVFIEDLVERSVQERLKRHNTLESIVAKNMNLLQKKIDIVISKIPDVSEGKIDQWIKSATKAMSKFKPENVKLIEELSNFAKGTGK